MKPNPDQYTVSLVAGNKQATGFLVHPSGWIATCYHFVESAFGKTGIKAGLRCNYTTLDGRISGIAQTTEYINPSRDVTLLKMDGEIPAEMQSVQLIRSTAISISMQTRFVLVGYAQPDYSSHAYLRFAADGTVLERVTRDDGIAVLMLDSKRIFKGLSGGAIYCPTLGGVVGMQSERLTVPETWGMNTAFACCSEDIAALMPDGSIPLQDPVVNESSALTRSLIEVFSAQSATIAVSDFAIKPLWTRPSEFDIRQRRWLGAVLREKHLTVMHKLIGTQQPLTRGAALVGAHGVGKSTLASIYVQKYGAEYPGGVLWADIGKDFDFQKDSFPILLRWYAYAYRGNEILASALLKQQGAQDVSLIRLALTSSNDELLVVLDDVHNADQIGLLLAALPANANILITSTETSVRAELAALNFHLYDLAGLDLEDAQVLLENQLPNVPPEEIKSLIEFFGGLPQPLVFIATHLMNQPDPRAALHNLLQQGVISEPVRAAFQLNYAALPNEEFRLYLRLLGVLAEVSGDFEAHLAGAIWDISIESAEPVLQLLADHAWIQFSEQHDQKRWSMNTPVRNYIRSILTDATEAQPAIQRYIETMTAYGIGKEIWTAPEPEIQHLLYVGNLLVTQSREQLIQSESATEPAVDPLRTEVLNRNAQFLCAAMPFLITRPETHEYAEPWIRTYCDLSNALGEAVASGWGNFALARWNLLNYRYREALEVLQQAETIAQDNQAYSLLGYALVDHAQIDRLSGKYEDAIQTLEGALNRLTEQEFDDPQLLVTILIGLTSIYLMLVKPDQALVFLQRARNLVEARGLQQDSITIALAQLSAVLMINQNQANEALKLLNRAYQLAQSLDDQRTLAEIEANLGCAYLQLGNLDPANEWLEKTLTHVDTIPYPYLKPAVLTLMAGLRYARGELIQSQSLLENALAIVQRPLDRDFNQEGQIRAMLGNVYYQLGQPTPALEMLQTAVDMLDKVKNTTTSINVINLIGKIFSETKRIDDGLKYFQDKKEQIRSLNNSGADVTLASWLAILLNDLGNFSEAMTCLERVQPLIEILENEEEQATVRTLIATLYRIVGDTELAFRELKRVEMIWLKLNNSQRLAEVRVTLAGVAYLNGWLDIAEQYLNDTQLVAESAFKSLLQAEYYNIRGSIAFSRTRFSEAQTMFERSSQINETLENPILRITNLNNLALIHLFVKHDREYAEKSLNEALKLAREMEFAPQIAMVLSNLGLLKYMRGLFGEAAQCLEEAGKTLESSGVKSNASGQSAEMLQMLARTFREQGTNADSRESLSLLLSAASWEAVALITHIRAELLLQSETDSIFQATIADAVKRGQKVLAGALRTYYQLIDDCRRYGINETLTRMMKNTTTIEIERWYAYVNRTNRDYIAALPHINRVLKLYPEDVDALIERGWIQRGLGRLDMALQDFTTVEKLNRANYQAYIGMGVVQYESNKFDQAVSYFSRALQEKADDASSHQWRAAVFQALGDSDGAMKDIEEATKLDAQNSAHQYWRALIALSAHRFELALSDLTAVVEKDKANQNFLAFDYFWLGIAYQQSGDSMGARFPWEKGDLMADANSWASPLYTFVLREEKALLKSVERLLKQPHAHHTLITQQGHWKLLQNLYQEDQSVVAGKVVKLITESFALKKQS